MQYYYNYMALPLSGSIIFFIRVPTKKDFSNSCPNR